MPSHNPVESLQNLCFDCVCHVIVTVVKNQGLQDRHSASAHKYDIRSWSAKHAHLSKRVDVWLKGMPVTLIDQLIPKTLHHFATRLTRFERLVGLQHILELLLQPQTSKLDLTLLFHMQRMASQINAKIERLVTPRVSAMPRLTELHLPAKCTDAVLRAAATACPQLQVLRLRLSYVTDEGVVYLVTRCIHLTVLDVQEVPTVTSVGVLSALQHCPALQQLHANNLLHILMAAFQGTSRTFLFTHLTHCSDNNRYPSGGLQWLLESFPVLEDVQLSLSFSDLHALRHLSRTAHTLDLEITEDYQELPWSAFGSSITTLVLNCNCISAAQLATIGRHCPQLQQLHLTTEAITDGHTLEDSAKTPLSRRVRKIRRPGAGPFKCLNHLALQVYGEPLHVAVFEWFLLQCPLLEVVWVSGAMNFLTDDYMKAMLRSPTLVNVHNLHLSSDELLDLTVSTIRRALRFLPALRNLSTVESWHVADKECKKWRQYCTDHNLDLHIS